MMVPSNILTRLDRQDKEIIFIGDTNCDLMDYRNANTKKLQQVYSEFQLEQLIKTYTRVAIKTSDNGTKRVSKSLIDHFSTSNARYIHLLRLSTESSKLSELKHEIRIEICEL